jgi:predicted nucleotidyltransferase
VSYTLEVIPKPRLDLILRELRQSLEALYGERLRGLYLFGSYARGDAEPGSDIDVAVVLEGEAEACVEIDRTSDMAAALSLEHTTVVSLMFVAESSLRDKWTPFLANLRREGIAV